MRPDQVTRMTDYQSKRVTEEERLSWLSRSLKPTTWCIQVDGSAKYTGTYRDETLRNGLIQVNAVVKGKISPPFVKTQDALRKEFADLFFLISGTEKLEEKSATGTSHNSLPELWHESS